MADSVANAQQFDSQYVVSSSAKKIIYCKDEDLILDYLIVKSASTKNLQNLVITATKELFHFNVVFSARASKAFKNQQLVNAGTTPFTFKSKSTVKAISDDGLVNKMSSKYDIIYVRSSSVVYLLLTQAVDSTIKPCLKDRSRLIYNF